MTDATIWFKIGSIMDKKSSRRNERCGALISLIISGTLLASCATSPVGIIEFSGMDVSNDDCSLAPIVNEYYSSGKHNEYTFRRPKSFGEGLYGYLVYSLDDPERYKARYQAPMDDLIKSVLSSDQYIHKPECSSRFKMTFGLVDFSQVWRAPSPTELCVTTRELNDDKPDVSARSCTNINTLANTISVSIKK